MNIVCKIVLIDILTLKFSTLLINFQKTAQLTIISPIKLFLIMNYIFEEYLLLI